MKDVLSYLDEREEEFEQHLSIARMLEARVDDTADEGHIHVEVRHVNTIKSGLLIHLYNIVEAITTRTLKSVGITVVSEKPGRWTDQVLKEWVRSEIWSGEERIGEGALTRLTNVSGTLASGSPLKAFAIKGEPGSWNDNSIRKVADRLGCKLVLTAKVRRAAYEKAYRNDTSAMTYLAQRRNAIAHGESTFEDGARDHTLDEIAELSTRILPFLRAVVISYKSFLNDKHYLTIEEEVA